MSPEALGAIQAIAVAVLVFAGQYVVAKISKRAQSETVEVDQQAKATEAWRGYAEKMEARLEGVEQRLADAETRDADNRRRISALERQDEANRDLIRRLLGRLRRALDEIRRLGGTVSEADLEVADLAQARLDLADHH